MKKILISFFVVALASVLLAQVTSITPVPRPAYPAQSAWDAKNSQIIAWHLYAVYQEKLVAQAQQERDLALQELAALKENQNNTNTDLQTVLRKIDSLYTYLKLESVSVRSVPSSVTLTWSDNSSNETGFKIERSNDGENFVVIGTTSANINTFIDTNIGVGTYWYRVFAYNSSGNSAPTNTVAFPLK